MEDKEEKQILPESTLRIIKDAQNSYLKMAENIHNLLPKLPELPKQDYFISSNPDVIYEENAWKRHAENLDVQNAILKVQKEILDEQKSTSKMTMLVIALTILGILVTLLSIFV